MNTWIRSSMIAFCALTCLTLTAKEPAKPPQQPRSEMNGFYFGGFGGWIFPVAGAESLIKGFRKQQVVCEHAHHL